MITQTKSNWKVAKLGEIVIPKGSVSGPFGSNIHSKFFTKDGVPVIRGNNLAIGFDPGRYVDNDYIYLSEKKADELSKSEALPEDIIVTARGTIGQTGIIPKKSRFKKYILSANQLRFRIDRKKANPLFVYYWLASKMMVRTMQNVSVNVGVPNLNLANTRNLQVPLPPLSMQGHIADILSAFDDKIELNNKISRTLEQMAQTIFKEWFVNFKFPGSAYAKATADRHEKVKMVDSELGKIPEGWEVKKVKEVCDQIVNGGTPRREVREYWANGNIPWVTTSELQNQVIIETTEKISKIGYENSSAKLLPQNTIIIALYASPTLGRLGLLKIEATTNQACSALVAKEEIGYGYLFYWLLNQRDYLQGLAVGAAQQNINQEVIRELNILMPDNQLLKRFQEVVSGVFDTLTNNTKENQKLSALRDLLLPKLMKGEIKV